MGFNRAVPHHVAGPLPLKHAKLPLQSDTRLLLEKHWGLKHWHGRHHHTRLGPGHFTGGGVPEVRPPDRQVQVPGWAIVPYNPFIEAIIPYNP